MGGVNDTLEHTSVTDKFLTKMGALLCDFASLTHTPYAEMCVELKLSSRTYAQV